MNFADLALKESDLIEMGLKPGPIFSQILNRLMDHVLNHPEDNNFLELHYRASFIAKEFEE